MTHAVEGKTPPAPLVKAFNTVLRPMLTSPLGSRLGEFMLLSFTGRKSGKQFRVPVTVHTDAEGLFAMTPAGWRVNFRGGADVDVTYRGRTTPMRGTLVEEVPAVARIYHDRITALGLKGAKRMIGLQFAEDRLPTLEEVADLVRRERFAVVRLSVKS